MADRTPIYEQFSRNRVSIRSTKSKGPGSVTLVAAVSPSGSRPLPGRQHTLRASNGSESTVMSSYSSTTNNTHHTRGTSYSEDLSPNSGLTVVGAHGNAGSIPYHQDPVAAFSKKIVVVGDGGSGKTCLLIRYKERTFPDKYVPTVFENYITYKPHKRTGKTVEVALWDTAGQEEYDRLRPLSYPETDIVLICYAVDCPTSLDSVKEKWSPEVSHFCPTTPVILVGCKSDLRDNPKCIDHLAGQGLLPITFAEGAGVARDIGARYIECSSKENINVDEVFELAMDLAIKQQLGLDRSGTVSGMSSWSRRTGVGSESSGNSSVVRTPGKRSSRWMLGGKGTSGSDMSRIDEGEVTSENGSQSAFGGRKKRRRGAGACNIM